MFTIMKTYFNKQKGVRKPGLNKKQFFTCHSLLCNCFCITKYENLNRNTKISDGVCEVTNEKITSIKQNHVTVPNGP